MTGAGERLSDLPEPLPKSERVLWQGKPEWQRLAIEAFHVRKVAIYFAILAAWRATALLADGATAGEAAVGAASLLGLGAAAGLLLAGLAWASARTTLYTITSRRLVMRIGIALPMTLNIPFRVVEGASVKLFSDGTGNIPLAIRAGDRIAILVLWPHARPWHVARPQPMLRAVGDAAQVARILGQALIDAVPAIAASGAMAVPTPQTNPAPAGQSQTSGQFKPAAA